MFVTTSNSRCTSALEKTSTSTLRIPSTKKNYLNLVTPSMYHLTLIRPVEEIKLFSCKHKKEKLILPLD